jgi:hypothetical protein
MIELRVAVQRLVLAATLASGARALPASAQDREPPASSSDVLEGIAPVETPVRTFLPKYKYEPFLVGGYMGTFGEGARQWPTLVLGLEGLLFRPGRFDFGLYADFQFGRADETLASVSSAFGLEIMWRVMEQSFWDIAPLIRGAYVVDWEHADQPLFRPGIGVQVSLLRFAALQAVVDGLFATSHEFSNDSHVMVGFAVALKMGIAPLPNTWPQYREPPLPTVDRSRVVCEDAARSCEAATSAGARDKLCAAALDALDPTRYPASWNDPTAPFLEALQREIGLRAPGVLDEPLRVLAQDHRSSMQGLVAYAEKQRALGESQMLNKKYSYLVTPVMIRGWLGCDADGLAARGPDDRMLACPTRGVCERDTGVRP